MKLSVITFLILPVSSYSFNAAFLSGNNCIGAKHETSFSYLFQYERAFPSMLFSSSDDQLSSSQSEELTPLCDLQTFLKLCQIVDTGAEAKHSIQSGQCFLNGEVETRRAKKLFAGDEVSFGTDDKKLITRDVSDVVRQKGYVYQKKKKKQKPVARIDPYGNLEFGGRYRSDEWRAQRKQRKAERKEQNARNRDS